MAVAAALGFCGSQQRQRIWGPRHTTCYPNIQHMPTLGLLLSSCLSLLITPCAVSVPQLQLQQFGPAAASSLQPARANSPSGSPLFRMGSSMATPFNRRVAVVYDTTASGRFLLKWATEMVLEPADNVFVVRAVPKVGGAPLPRSRLHACCVLCPVRATCCQRCRCCSF
jgi:hypothetical protein